MTWAAVSWLPLLTLIGALLVALNVWLWVRLVRAPAPRRDFSVLAVGSTDAYLNHVLRTHDVDIHHHQPDFVWRPHASDLQAFLVQKGDETVGVVVVRAEGATAHVELDYVTPPFRDCAAGEYVWLRSDILRHRGLRQVVTPARMRDPYYDRLGFRPHGAGYLLDLTAPAVGTRPVEPA